MSRATINFFLDGFLFLLVVLLMWLTAILKFIIPVASQATGWRLWGMSFDAWHRIHTVVFAVFVLAVLLHLILHWTWVCGFVAARVGKWRGRHLSTNEATRTLYGVATLALILCLLGIALFAAQFAIRAPAPSG